MSCYTRAPSVLHGCVCKERTRSLSGPSTDPFLQGPALLRCGRAATPAVQGHVHCCTGWTLRCAVCVLADHASELKYSYGSQKAPLTLSPPRPLTRFDCDCDPSFPAPLAALLSSLPLLRQTLGLGARRERAGSTNPRLRVLLLFFSPPGFTHCPVSRFPLRDLSRCSTFLEDRPPRVLPFPEAALAQAERRG